MLVNYDFSSDEEKNEKKPEKIAEKSKKNPVFRKEKALSLNLKIIRGFIGDFERKRR